LNLILGFHHHHDSNGMEEAVRKADQQETNVTELMETNGGFRNLTNNGVPRKRGHSITIMMMETKNQIQPFNKEKNKQM
jgi:hypothetical protein